MTEHPNVQTVRDALDSMTETDVAALAAVVAENIEYHQIGAPGIMGKAALIESMEALGEMEFGLEVHDVLANDDHSIALLDVTVKAAGQEFKYRTAEIYHLEDGKITKRWAFSDDTQAITDFFAKLAAG